MRVQGLEVWGLGVRGFCTVPLYGDRTCVPASCGSWLREPTTEQLFLTSTSGSAGRYCATSLAGDECEVISRPIIMMHFIQQFWSSACCTQVGIAGLDSSCFLPIGSAGEML